MILKASLAVASIAAAAALAPLGAAEDGKPSCGCGQGFNLGSVTLTEYLALPRTQAAINDGVTTPERILAGLTPIDKNGNGRVCVQESHALEVTSRPLAQYLYNLVDDNSSSMRD